MREEMNKLRVVPGYFDLPFRKKEGFYNWRQNNLDTDQLEGLHRLVYWQCCLAPSYEGNINSGWALEGLIVAILLHVKCNLDFYNFAR